MNHPKHYILLLAAILYYTYGMAAECININRPFFYKELGRELEYFSTKKNAESIQSVLSKPNISYTKNIHDMLLLNEDEYENDLWVHFKICNNSDEEKELILQLNNSLINWVEYYEVVDTVIISSNISGDNLALSKRRFFYKNPIYDIKLKPQETRDIYFKFDLNGRKIHVPLELYSYTYFVEQNLKVDINLGFFYGILACLSCVCFILFYLLRERIYFYLASYFTSQIFLQLAISGVGYVLLWTDFPIWNDKSTPILMSLSILLATVFLVEFLKKENINKVFLFYIKPIQYLSIVLFFAAFTSGIIFDVAVWILYRLIPVFYVGFFVLSSYFFLNKFLPARFFFFAFALAMLSIGAIYYYALTKSHNNVFTNQWVILGEILKSILLTLAVLDRLRIFKEEKEKAQRLVIQQLEEMNKLKENANTELLQKVEEKTIELSQKQNEVKKALILGEEQERKRVAQELHDGLGSLLSTLRLNAESIDLNNKGLSTKEYYAYQNVIELIDKACTELRNISHNMTPIGIEQFGLVQQLISFIRKINDSELLQLHLDTFGLEERLSKDIELVVYRICLELINNIIKHSRAKKATIQLVRNNDFLNIIIEDDGIGFDSKDNTIGLGLNSIRSRVDAFNGKFTIDSNKHSGTTIIIELPIQYEQ